MFVVDSESKYFTKDIIFNKNDFLCLMTGIIRDKLLFKIYSNALEASWVLKADDRTEQAQKMTEKRVFCINFYELISIVFKTKIISS